MGSITTPSDRLGWLIQAFLIFLRASSQFREKAQRYHNPILSNARGRERSAACRRAPLASTHHVDGRHLADMLKGALSPRVTHSGRIREMLSACGRES